METEKHRINDGYAVRHIFSIIEGLDQLCTRSRLLLFQAHQHTNSPSAFLLSLWTLTAMDITTLLLNLFTNADAFLVSLANNYGFWIYLVMFLIFFLETGFVVMSFLPGDSLLFVAGTVAASGTTSPWLLMLAVFVGAVAGNSLGYEQGRWLGKRIYSGDIRWINADKLRTAHDFYLKHGGKTVLLARFIPIVRAFAPLIAGAARMNGLRFEFYSATGAALWAFLLIGSGYLFGNIPFIKNNLSLILLLGMAAAVTGPILVGSVWRYFNRKKSDHVRH